MRRDHGCHDSATARRQRPDPQLGAPRAAAQRAVSAKSGLGLKVPGRSARERHAAARPSHAGAAARARPTQPRGPRKTARTHQHTRWRTRRDSENLAAAARRPELARARGHVAAAVRATHQKHITQKIAPTRPTHATRLRTRQQRRPASLQRDQSRVSEDDDDIHVIKRNGKKEVVRYDKITSRIKKLCYGLDSKYIKPNVPRQSGK